MKLFILRHGTTLWNIEHRIQGASDIPLDETGEEIARITGQGLLSQGIHFQYAFSSPLIRAYKTAQLVALNTPVQTDPRLMELSFGSFEGHQVEEMFRDENCAFRYFKTEPEKYNALLLEFEKLYPAMHYESLASLLSRAGEFIRDKIEPLIPENETEHSDINVLIAGHGALNKALMMYLQGNTDFASFWGKGLQDNCGIYIAEASRNSSGEITYNAPDDCITFYDPNINPRCQKLF